MADAAIMAAELSANVLASLTPLEDGLLGECGPQLGRALCMHETVHGLSRIEQIIHHRTRLLAAKPRPEPCSWPCRCGRRHRWRHGPATWKCGPLRTAQGDICRIDQDTDVACKRFGPRRGDDAVRDERDTMRDHMPKYVCGKTYINCEHHNPSPEWRSAL